MKIKWLLVIGVFLLVCNCGEKETTKPQAPPEKQESKSKITEKNLAVLKYDDYALSGEAKVEVVNWNKYQELATQIDYLKKADLSFFNTEKDTLQKFLKEFKEKTPENIRTKLVISRVAVLQTQLLKLNTTLNLGTSDKQAKIYNIKEVLVAFSNLNFLINKKLEKDYYDKIKPE